MSKPTSDALAAAERRGELRARREAQAEVAYTRGLWNFEGHAFASARSALDEATQRMREAWREADRKRRAKR